MMSIGTLVMAGLEICNYDDAIFSRSSIIFISFMFVYSEILFIFAALLIA